MTFQISFNPQPKPTHAEDTAARDRVPGPTAQRRARKAHRTARAGHVLKVAVRHMDGDHCRWPGCETPPELFWGRLEAAHWKAAGAGGDPQLKRGIAANLIALCRWHHLGPHGLHSGLARMEPLTELGTRGPVEFLQCIGGVWVVVGVSAPPAET